MDFDRASAARVYTFQLARSLLRCTLVLGFPRPLLPCSSSSFLEKLNTYYSLQACTSEVTRVGGSSNLGLRQLAIFGKRNKGTNLHFNANSSLTMSRNFCCNSFMGAESASSFKRLRVVLNGDSFWICWDLTSKNHSSTSLRPHSERQVSPG